MRVLLPPEADAAAPRAARAHGGARARAAARPLGRAARAHDLALRALGRVRGRAQREDGAARRRRARPRCARRTTASSTRCGTSARSGPSASRRAARVRAAARRHAAQGERGGARVGQLERELEEEEIDDAEHEQALKQKIRETRRLAGALARRDEEIAQLRAQLAQQKAGLDANEHDALPRCARSRCGSRRSAEMEQKDEIVRHLEQQVSEHIEREEPLSAALREAQGHAAHTRELEAEVRERDRDLVRDKAKSELIAELQAELRASLFSTSARSRRSSPRARKSCADRRGRRAAWAAAGPPPAGGARAAAAAAAAAARGRAAGVGGARRPQAAGQDDALGGAARRRGRRDPRAAVPRGPKHGHDTTTAARPACSSSLPALRAGPLPQEAARRAQGRRQELLRLPARGRRGAAQPPARRALRGAARAARARRTRGTSSTRSSSRSAGSSRSLPEDDSGPVDRGARGPHRRTGSPRLRRPTTTASPSSCPSRSASRASSATAPKRRDAATWRVSAPVRAMLDDARVRASPSRCARCPSRSPARLAPAQGRGRARARTPCSTT